MDSLVSLPISAVRNPAEIRPVTVTVKRPDQSIGLRDGTEKGRDLDQRLEGCGTFDVFHVRSFFPTTTSPSHKMQDPR